ncbi:MAG TPA: hypothetical protein VFF67_03230 [Thermoplasmata archaeon]|nr:hypothetical protein [Thermoplasmata archaeon]
MQSGITRESRSARRARVACPKCGAIVEFSRMRVHLRDAHHVGAAELESNILNVRKEAIRSGRGARR